MGVYLHVPFCASRCGYCDFNTYTTAELAGRADAPGYLEAARAEIALAARTLGHRRVDTVFVGGGTPTLLPARDLTGLLRCVRDAFELDPGAEVTTEANPETITPAYLDTLLAAGFTRISLGMQSASTRVLRLLDRVHTPGRAVEAAQQARAAGFAHVSLDLIYGTPGESDDDWQASLAAVLAADVDHVSAYALVVESGTALARKVRRGEIADTDGDVLADRYEMADAALGAAGFAWYEVSNWARTPDDACRHNVHYWHGDDWWGIGPGAHSHVAGRRWWNVKHPAAYAAALADGSPEAGSELLTESERATEHVLLQVRLAEGLAVEGLPADAVREVVQDGLAVLAAGRIVLTLRGRLLADAVVRRLLP